MEYLLIHILCALEFNCARCRLSAPENSDRRREDTVLSKGMKPATLCVSFLAIATFASEDLVGTTNGVTVTDVTQGAQQKITVVASPALVAKLKSIAESLLSEKASTETAIDGKFGPVPVETTKRCSWACSHCYTYQSIAAYTKRSLHEVKKAFDKSRSLCTRCKSRYTKKGAVCLPWSGNNIESPKMKPMCQARILLRYKSRRKLTRH